MSKKTDSNSYTMIFAVIMVLLLDLYWHSIASSLKPTIDEEQENRKATKHFVCMGVNENEERVQHLFLQKLQELNFTNTSKNKLIVQGGMKYENEPI